MPTIHDKEFGAITVRKSARATQVRLRVAPDGTLRASLPLYAPMFLLKRLIASSRAELRGLISQSLPQHSFTDGQTVGKSHALIVRRAALLAVHREKQRIYVDLPDEMVLSDPQVVNTIRPVVIAALRLEAKSYLPKRLKYLAEQHGFTYKKVRFSHASSRWGSCSSEGTISLNIALMKLPFELIDYVLIHELTHTKHMNHSEAFWLRVSEGDPHYIAHRGLLKQETPSI